MRPTLISVVASLSLLLPVGSPAIAPAAASVPAGPAPVATGNSLYGGLGGPTDVAVGRDRSVYITIEGWAERKLFRHQTSYTVTSKQKSGGTASLTIGTHLLKVGDPITVNISDPDFDGIATVTAVTSTTVSFAATGTVAATAASGVVVPDPISGGTVEITPSLPAGVQLSGPRAIAVSPDRSSIAVGYMGNAGIAVYPWDASGATAPTRILLGPAGTSAGFGIRDLAWDSQGNIYALMEPKGGSPAQIWVFGQTAGQTDAPSRQILLNAGTASDAAAWSGWSWSWISSGMALGPNDEIAVAGNTSLGWVIAYVAPGLSGDTQPSGYLRSGVHEVWGLTYDDSGRSIITYLNDRGLRAWAPGVRSTVNDPSPAPVVDVSRGSQGPTRGPLAFDATDRSIVLASGDEYGFLRRYATGPSATSTTLALPYLGTPGSNSPGSSTPPSPDPGPPPPTSPEPTTTAPSAAVSTIEVPATPADSSGTGAPEPPAPPAITAADVSLPGLPGARLVARGATGSTCLGSQCVSGRRWTLQLCLPQEARISVQRRVAKRWVNQRARNSTIPPLACPAPTRSASITVPAKTQAKQFRIVLRIQDAPRIVSGLRVR